MSRDILRNIVALFSPLSVNPSFRTMVSLYRIVFPRSFVPKEKESQRPKKSLPMLQAWPRSCNCLFLFPQALYRSAECIYHPIVHYIVVVERSCKDVPIPNWKESGSEFASQRLEVLELRRKLRDNVLKSIFAHVALLCIRNFCIYPSIPTSQYICLRSHQLVWFLPSCTFVAILNAHPYEDVKK